MCGLHDIERHLITIINLVRQSTSFDSDTSKPMNALADALFLEPEEAAFGLYRKTLDDTRIAVKTADPGEFEKYF
jgi:hypothetical protein